MEALYQKNAEEIELSVEEVEVKVNGTGVFTPEEKA